MRYNAVITVGFCPAWDVTCRAEDVDWGRHCKVSQTAVPAGKALNVSQAMAWLGDNSIAAGLWGQDLPLAVEALAGFNGVIDFRPTCVPGRTRQNITVIDTRGQREMHLRAPCRLATREALARLKDDLRAMADAGSLVVFSGSMPEGDLLEDCLSVVREVWGRGADVAVDTSGEALGRAVDIGGLYVIKPNMEELAQLFGRPMSSDSLSIMVAARTLCSRVKMVLVSRGADGAMIVTHNQAFSCRAKPTYHRAVNTVGCGDYLLAGFLAGDVKLDLRQRLENAVRLATARAWGLPETMTWADVTSQVEVETFAWG